MPVNRPFLETPCTAFRSDRKVASGPLFRVVARLKDLTGDNPPSDVLIFHDETGATIEVDLRGDQEAALRRLAAHPDAAVAEAPGTEGAPARGVGRPKLGVVSGEVTLLPRHWAWLKSQSGGASVTLRRLVDAARRDAEGSDAARRATDATYRFMAAMAGDRPDYEEALRALFAGDGERFREHVQGWPPDIRDHARTLATAAFADAAG